MRPARAEDAQPRENPVEVEAEAKESSGATWWPRSAGGQSALPCPVLGPVALSGGRCAGVWARALGVPLHENVIP